MVWARDIYRVYLCVLFFCPHFLFEKFLLTGWSGLAFFYVLGGGPVWSLISSSLVGLDVGLQRLINKMDKSYSSNTRTSFSEERTRSAVETAETAVARVHVASASAPHTTDRTRTSWPQPLFEFALGTRDVASFEASQSSSLVPESNIYIYTPPQRISIFDL